MRTDHLRGPQIGPASIWNPHTCRRQPEKTHGHRVSEIFGPGPNLPAQQTPTALPAARPSWLEIYVKAVSFAEVMDVFC